MPTEKEYPSNSKMVQNERKIKRARQNAPVRADEELLEGGKELVNRKIISPVVKGTVKVRKKNIFQKLSGALFGNDKDSVGTYVLWDVLIPAAKDTIQDMVTTGIEMLLFGESTGRNSRRRKGDRTYVSYGSYFQSPPRGSNYRTGVRDSRRGRDYVRVPGYHNRLDGIAFESRGEAEEVLDALVDLLEQYEEVSISEFYELAGLSNMSEYTDNAWGWTSLGRARIMHTRAGWEIDFPRPIELD